MHCREWMGKKINQLINTFFSHLPSLKCFDDIFGIAKGKFVVPDDFDEPDDEIARMFGMID